MLDVFAPRPAGDFLSRSVRITLGDTEYVLRVLFIAGNERWLDAINAKFNGLTDRLRIAGKDTAEIYAALGDQPDDLIELLVSYDTDDGRRPGVLPAPEAIKESTYEGDLLVACREVWRAASPLVVMRVAQALARIDGPPTSDSSQPTSSPPKPTAGRSKRSAKH